jgi:hypothetical protein
VVDALERIDPRYPALLARGVLYSRVGNHVAAAGALRLHLDQHPGGSWALRARNYLAAALDHVPAGEPL